jgi:gamma-glutamyltranspeptidase / glutathione hydrolase
MICNDSASFLHQAIVDLIQSKGGCMELEDLASHKSEVVDPISYTYANDLTVYEVRQSHI